MSELLQVSGVSFAYGVQPVLREVSLTLSPGQVVVLIGPNGSGKSTLIKILIGHLRGSGSIRWNDRPIRSWPRRELARLIAYLPQAPAHEPGQHVSDVLRLGRTPYWSAFGIESPRDMEVVSSVARRLGLEPILNRPIDEISGGQRQMVFLGRALVQEPRAMLLDEPSTFLDLRHQVEIGRLLRDLAKDQSLAVLVASHDLNLAGAFADRLILLDRGAVAAQGAPRDVLTEEILTRVYGVAVRRVDQDASTPIIVPELR